MKKQISAALVAGGLVLGAGIGAGAASAATARPDLVVTAVKWAPVATVAGQKVRFTATVTNRGTAATPAGTITGVGFSVNGKLVTWSDTERSAIAPGESRTLTANGGPTGDAAWTATSGRSSVTAFVDDAKRITESTETNNTLSATVDVAAGIAVRPSELGLLVDLPASSRATFLTTSLTGDAYAGCVTDAGAVLAGSEQFQTTYTVGNDTPTQGKWQDGQDRIAAGQTRVQTDVSFSLLMYSNQGHFPFTCPAGSTAQWTTFASTSTTATRWPGADGTGGAALARVSVPISTVFPIAP
ncbi:CARDB domain-containing protein [Kineococcus gynurae]|uniref:CARDB domain-containing protein n=1 Tax=Kineococcus gynurae TaxID=452979 RepID=A0ABV5LN07_9ACTN